MFDETKHIVDELPECTDYAEYFISIDYRTIKPCSTGLWRVEYDKAIRIKEMYYDSKKAKKQLTDEEYYTKLEELSGDLLISAVIVDPSAASFIETIRRHGRFSVRKAN